MAVLLSLKQLENVEASLDTEENTEHDKYSKYNENIFTSYFKNLLKSNSYKLEKPAKKKSPLPGMVKEFFTAKTIDEVATKVGDTRDESLDDQEILLDDQRSNSSSVALNSFTNLQLRLLNDSLEEAEESFEKLVKDNSETTLDDHDSITFSFDDDSLKDGCFGQLHIQKIDLCKFEHEIDLYEDEDDSTDSDSDAVKSYLEGEEEAEQYSESTCI